MGVKKEVRKKNEEVESMRKGPGNYGVKMGGVKRSEKKAVTANSRKETAKKATEKRGVRTKRTTK